MGVFNTKEEAERLAKYMSSHLFHFMVAIVKNSQHNSSARTYAHVPQLPPDFDPTEENLFALFNLTPDEIEYVKGRTRKWKNWTPGNYDPLATGR